MFYKCSAFVMDKEAPQFFSLRGWRSNTKSIYVKK